jgi:membrane fusion protein (multidrug efflux system)
MAKKEKDTLTTASGSPVADNQNLLMAGARGPMKKRLLLSLFLPTVIVAVLLVPADCEKSEQSQVPPPEVEVVQVEQKDVPISKEWVGTLDGLVNAQIRPQVTGYLLRQTYQEGSFVEKGQLLFEIDPRTFQAALDQAKAQLANAVQQLALAEANQVRAQLDVNRYVPLAKEEAVTQ